MVRDIHKVETAVEPRFQEHFVDAMAIPHKTAAYPNLAKAIELPQEKPTSGEQPDHRTRRRRKRAQRQRN